MSPMSGKSRPGARGRGRRRRDAPPIRNARSAFRSARAPVAAIVLAAVTLVVAAVLKTHHPAHAAAPTPRVATAAPATLGRLRAAPPAGPLGPEQVPVAPGPALAPAGSLAAGQSVDGISSA